MTPASEWDPAPAHPALERDEAAVWRLPAETSHPIESVVASYLGSKADSVVLRRSRRGKPELEGSPLRVSLAHSGEVALVAVTRDREIGVDVERRRAGIENWSLVSHVLTESERASLEALPASRRSEALLSVWTRKEALLKAVGVGLSLDPRLIELDGRSVVDAPRELGAASDWTLVDLPLQGYAAALALEGPLGRLSLYDARP